MRRVIVSKASPLVNKKPASQSAALKRASSYFPISVQKNYASKQSAVNKTNNAELMKKQNTKTLPANTANMHKLCENQADEQLLREIYRPFYSRPSREFLKRLISESKMSYSTHLFEKYPCMT